MINLTRLVGGKETVSALIRGDKETQGRWVSHAPVVVWNVTNICNLRCIHCYANSLASKPRGELTTEEGLKLIDNLASIGVPLLILSGGEPLLREDIFELCRHAVKSGIKTVFSTNGIDINESVVEALKRAGASYVGVSVDGLKKTHERIRGVQGCFDRAMEALELLKESRLKTGIRFTVNRRNIGELESIFDLMIEREIPRICIYHLAYSGRGMNVRGEDLSTPERRWLLDFLIAKSLEFKGEVDADVETVNSPADGVYTYLKLWEVDKGLAARAMKILRKYGGDPTGYKVANIDHLGLVHPNQFWWDHMLGSVRNEKFNAVWFESRNHLLLKLRSKWKYVKGRCGRCRYKGVCAGYRLRALRVHGDVWAEDPGCFLSEEEIS
ncbi:MAG: radical SAM protein [Nitrososphaeria archaeon]|nr:radical SAM protein [Nitrososphaeria archaeon]NIQ33236.1 radical SAM protein [Nitrososphaeria archaeon]